ncbi:hypothetical protein K4K59_005787 [Colletotrichum sp. SAR11_240]|nr:hypothetical protein K4K59_005787 [Colletotrichum sp. SAR11_240]
MDPTTEPAHAERRSDRPQKPVAIESGEDSDDDPLSIGSRTSFHTNNDVLDNLSEASSNSDQSYNYEDDSDVESTDDEDDDLIVDPDMGIVLDELGMELGELSDFSDDEECVEITSDEEDVDELIATSRNSGIKRAAGSRGGDKKRRRSSKPPFSFVAETAATWLAKCNEMHPVDDDDSEMADFHYLFHAIDALICNPSI